MKTKEELLKIYGAYAPYKLHILHIEKNMRFIISGCYFHENMDENIQLKLLNWESKVNSDQAKPILYSMDMLTQDEFNFIWNQETDLESLEQFISLDWESRLSCKFSFSFWDKLFKYHFNVFGLDESEYIQKQSVI